MTEDDEPPQIKSSATPPASAYYDDAGRFIHNCSVCGADAPFGFRVSLRNDQLGIWYCRAHRP
jgi:hypothetical protein